MVHETALQQTLKFGCRNGVPQWNAVCGTPFRRKNFYWNGVPALSGSTTPLTSSLLIVDVAFTEINCLVSATSVHKTNTISRPYLQ
jgi:hypothetical protein